MSNQPNRLDREQQRASITMRAKNIVIPQDRHIDGDWHDLVEDIKSKGMLQPIGVRHSSDNKEKRLLVWGHKRLKAMLSIDPNAQIEIIDLGDITDDEAAAAELSENLYRHSYNTEERAKMLARAVELQEKIIAKRMEDDKRAAEVSGQNDQKPNGGRPAEPRAAAIRQVAQTQGVSESTVKRAVAPRRNERKPRVPTKPTGKVTKHNLPSLKEAKAYYDALAEKTKRGLLEHIVGNMDEATRLDFIASISGNLVPPRVQHAASTAVDAAAAMGAQQ